MGIIETGDSAEMLDSLDIAVREKNNSVYKPQFEFIMNDAHTLDDVVEIMKNYPTLSEIKKGKDQNAAYIRYNNWSLDFATDLVSYMNDSKPGVNYILLANAGGLDEAGHNLGSDGYESVLAGLDPKLLGLIDACRRSNVTLIITADHGMSFKDATSKGSHASESVAFRDESKLVPLLIYSSNKDVKGSGLYEQQDVAPTLLSLLDCPNTLSMCDGEPLPVKEKPTLYLRSKQPANVTVTGPGLSDTVSFNGTYAIRSLDRGKYSIRNGGYEKDIDLRFDTLVDVPGDGQSGPALPSWAAYAAAGIVSITGILAALRFIWRK
jgi:arylsulfatase A-like enzyme